MEIRVLKYFLTVAREENITNAAKILHITQPTLSRQLMQLEEELGTSLFIRGKRKLVLTEQGMLLRRRAEEIVELADKTEREFNNQEDFIGGEISIGGGESNSMRALITILDQFHQEYPQIQYQLYSGNADDIKERLDKGLLDIGLLMEPVDVEKYEFIRIDQKERWGVLVHKDNKIALKKSVKAKDLIGQKLINTRRTLVQNELASWFGDYYEQLEFIATYNLIYNAALMVQQGLGCAICLEKLVNIHNPNELCFVPFEPVLETGTVIVWKKHQISSPLMRTFIEKLKHTLKA